MHSGNIENYSFIHGYHRNNLTGKWFPLHPHTLGRALTHDEMDYNLLYSQQTVAGWRIFGLNADLTLSDDEIGNSLIFHKIRTTDTDYARYVASGYTENMYIWITPIYDCTEFYVNGEAFTTSTQRDCSGFVITLSDTSPSIDSCDIFGINSTNTSSSKPEGWIYVPKSIDSGSGSGSGGGSGPSPTATPNIGSGSGSGGGSGITPTATPNIGSGSGSGSGGGSGIVPTATPNIGSGSGSGGGSGIVPTATPLPDPTATSAPVEVSYMTLKDDTGGEAEEGEIFKFIVETTGIEGSASIGYRLGGSAVQDVDYRTAQEVNRQIIYQNKATIQIEVLKGVGRAIEIILDTEDSQGNKTNDLAHVVKIVAASDVDNPEPTPIPPFEEPDPTATAIPVPTTTPVPDPTATAIPDPTATPVPEPTATSEPINDERENYIFTKCREGDEGDINIIVDSSKWRTLTGLPEPKAVQSTLMNVYTNACYSYTKITSEPINVDIRDYQTEKCSCESEGEPEGEPVDS